MVDAFDYFESQTDADELIQEFGRAVEIVRVTPGSGPVWDPGPGISLSFPTFAVRVDYTLKQVQAGAVLDGAERWLVAAGPLSAGLTASDKIEIAGIQREIMEVKPLQPADVVVLYDCQVRK